MKLRRTWAVTLPGWIDLAPLVHRSRLHVRAARHLLALDPATGDELWRTDVDPANGTGWLLAASGETIITSRDVDGTTWLIGVGLDGAVRWETPTDVVIGDAHCLVDGHLVAFGHHAGGTRLLTVEATSGTLLASVAVRHPPSGCFPRDGRVFCLGRTSPGVFSLLPDGADEREEVSAPVVQGRYDPPHLVLCLSQEISYAVEVRGPDLAARWSRPSSWPLVALRDDEIAVIESDAAGRPVPALVGADTGTLLRSGSALSDRPEDLAVLDRVVAVRTPTALTLLSRDDLREVSRHPLASHAVQTAAGIALVAMNTVEGLECRAEELA